PCSCYSLWPAKAHMRMSEERNVHPSLRALLAEDDPVDAELTLSFLGQAGYEIDAEVVSGMKQFEEALNNRAFDVILSDHNMGNWNGMDALELYQKSGRNTPFIIVTASLGDEAAVEYLKQGASDYVLKGHLERLPLAIARALREKKYKDEL